MERHVDFQRLARVQANIEQCSAVIRAQESDFQVEEVLPFEPDGEGGHAWLLIRKQGINTEWLARQLASYAGVPQLDVGYAGLKDRHAITTQWFSIKLEGVSEPDWFALEIEGVDILTVTRHGKKLRRGVLSGNRFQLRLTSVSGDESLWQQRLKTVAEQGVPNYYAEQRFGHEGNNLRRVAQWFETGRGPKKRHQKSLYLSSARSWLFNWVLSQRIEHDSWNQLLIGEQVLLAGTRASLFSITEVDETLCSRLKAMDIHPTGPLWGRGENQSTHACLTIEQQSLALWSDWQLGLEKAGLKQERRSLRLFPEQFQWQIEKDAVELSFFLPAGCYATAVLRELAIISDADLLQREKGPNDG